MMKMRTSKIHVGTGAFARPVEQSSTAILYTVPSDGCPTLARSVRKGGNYGSMLRRPFVSIAVKRGAV